MSCILICFLSSHQKLPFEPAETMMDPADSNSDLSGQRPLDMSNVIVTGGAANQFVQLGTNQEQPNISQLQTVNAAQLVTGQTAFQQVPEGSLGQIGQNLHQNQTYVLVNNSGQAQQVLYVQQNDLNQGSAVAMHEQQVVNTGQAGTSASGGQTVHLREPQPPPQAAQNQVNAAPAEAKVNSSRDKVLKKPTNSYILWANQARKQVVEENKGEDCRKVNSTLGKMWRAMPDSEKRTWREKWKKINDVNKVTVHHV